MKNMNRKDFTTGLALSMLMTLAACSSLDEGLEQETAQGKLELKLTAGTNFSETRALNEESYRNTANYTVEVLDKDGTSKLNCKGSELASKMPLTLGIGSYTVKASYGTSHAASRDEFYVEGTAVGTIRADGTEEVSVVCTPTCGRVRVTFDSDMSTYFSDYNVTFSGTQALGTGSVAWAKNDTEPWYLELDEAGETLTFTLTTNTRSEYIHSGNQQETNTKTGTFSLDRNKAYNLNVSPTYNPTGDGTVSIEITIDESTNDIEVPIEVPVEWI